MSHDRIRHKPLQMVSTLAVPLLLSTNALATDESNLNALLQGTYGLSLSQTCVQAPGFTSDHGGPLTGSGQTIHYGDSGTVRFNGNGSMEVHTTDVIQVNTELMATDQTPVEAGLSSDCAGRYLVKPDRSYRAKLTCTVDDVLTIAPIIATGWIGFLGQTLTLV